MRSAFWLLLLCGALPVVESQLNFDCSSMPSGQPCLRNPDGSRMKIKVKYIDADFVVSNSAAKARVAASGHPQLLSVCDLPETAVPDCFKADNWNGGWVGSFVYPILGDLGVEVIALTDANTSTAAKQAYSGASSYTLCVWEVKMGYVDLCVGDFWETPSRRNMTSFTTSLDPDVFSLYTMPSPDLNPPFRMSDLLGIFAPFDSAVWLLLLIAVAFFSLAMWIIEASNDSKEYPPNIFGFMECMYQTTLSFVGGEHIANFLPSRILKVGLGVLVYVYMNSYIASLASHFVVDNVLQSGVVNSLADIQTAGGQLCILQSMVDATAGLFPRALALVAMDGIGPMLEKLYAGNCSAAVLSRFDALTYIVASTSNFTVCTDRRDPNNFAQCADATHKAETFRLDPATCGPECAYARRYCQLVQLNDPVVATITLSFSLPARKDLAPWLSAAIMRRKGLGNLTSAKARELYGPNAAVCSGPAPWSNSLTPTQLSGAYLVCGGLMALGALVHLASLLSFRFSARAEERSSSHGSTGNGWDPAGKMSRRAHGNGAGSDVLEARPSADSVGGEYNSLVGMCADQIGALLAKAKQLD